MRTLDRASHVEGIGLYYYGPPYYDPALGRFVQPDTIVPEPGNPQSLNRYAYTLNNPLRYTDPTGYIEEDEADEAQRIVQLLQELYGVYIQVDWGWQPVTAPAPGQPPQVWNEGLWEMSQLNTVLEAVQDFARVAGSAEATRKAIGGVAIFRTETGGAHYLLGAIYLDTGHFSQQSPRDVFGPKIGIVHELAHYWDFKGGLLRELLLLPGALSMGMRMTVDGEGGPTAYGRTALLNEKVRGSRGGKRGVIEDWAESVTIYIYPVYQKILQQEGNPREVRSPNSPGLRGLHSGYVSSQFAALAVESNK